MDNQKMNTERLIASFDNTSTKWVSVYRSQQDDTWNHYYDLTGNLDSLYFHVIIRNNKEDDVDIVKIDILTGCKQEIEALLIKFNLV
jgi:hypothetical protein